jgi:hypothetical protein
MYKQDTLIFQSNAFFLTQNNKLTTGTIKYQTLATTFFQIKPQACFIYLFSPGYEAVRFARHVSPKHYGADFLHLLATFCSIKCQCFIYKILKSESDKLGFTSGWAQT